MFQLFVEGQGEVAASQKLIQKIVAHYNLGNQYFSVGRRIPNLHTEEGLRIAIEIARIDSSTEGVLILRDDEDSCPKEIAPKRAAFLQSLNAPFPISYCIMYREYETMFLAYAPHFAGKTIKHAIRGEIRFEQNISVVPPESIRGAKEAISSYLSGGRKYKPTVDQLTLTQAMDIEILSGLQLASFDTLVRCVHHLIKSAGQSLVYPIIVKQ